MREQVVLQRHVNHVRRYNFQTKLRSIERIMGVRD